MKAHIQRLIRLLPITLALLMAQNASADSKTITDGESLAASCYLTITAIEKGLESISDNEQIGPFVCLAYLSGVLDAAHHANNLSKLRFAQMTEAGTTTSASGFNLYCIDWNMRHEDAARIVLRYARQHMELARQPAEKLVMKALRDAYPCPR